MPAAHPHDVLQVLLGHAALSVAAGGGAPRVHVRLALPIKPGPQEADVVQRDCTWGVGRRATPAEMLDVRAEVIVAAAMTEKQGRIL